MKYCWKLINKNMGDSTSKDGEMAGKNEHEGRNSCNCK